MLEAIGAGSRKRIGSDWGEKWRNSPEFAEVKREIQELKAEALAKPIEEKSNRTEYGQFSGTWSHPIASNIII